MFQMGKMYLLRSPGEPQVTGFSETNSDSIPHEPKGGPRRALSWPTARCCSQPPEYPKVELTLGGIPSKSDESAPIFRGPLVFLQPGTPMKTLP